MKKRNVFLAGSVLVFILTAGIGRASAYFTTYTEAKGGYPIALGDKVTVEEDVSSWVKHVKIKSDEGSKPVYTRVKVFCGSQYSLVYSDDGGKWTPGSDGYYYYSDVVTGGETTKELLVKIEDVPEDVKDSDSFNVVVVYESTPVLYKDDGTPYADWSRAVETGRMEGGA